ncbi:alpha/beta hydrolase [Collinsella sp. LCP21S3_C7]|uniref:alpha/beta hydrolase n=1 Tax=Collinsella sp. LCP21S3_C7 TaxID=3438772 RepID=UPI002A93FA09|nr:alpha/beta hydrolase-fold protein [Collinsella sp.]
MEARQKQITIHSKHVESAPVIYLPAVMGDGTEVYSRCLELDCPPFTLVAIGELDWNRELSPWECDGTVRDAEPFGGQASEFLDELLNRIIPEVEPSLPCPPTWRGIAGYSLAGLFSLWSLWQTDAFDRAASASGSLWFPGFLDYAHGHTMSAAPNAVYLSLGKKETKTPNRMMRHVLDDTRAMEKLLGDRGIPATFELNPGNHFAQTDVRMARGIHWILTH